MNESTTPPGSPQAAVEETKKELTKVVSIIESKTSEHANAVSAANAATILAQRLEGELHSLFQRKGAMEQWIHNMEMDGSELKGNLRSYVLWFLQRNKDRAFHFSRDLLPALTAAGVQVLGRNGEQIRIDKQEKKLNTLLNDETGEGGHLKRVIVNGDKRGGCFQWTDVPNPKVEVVVATETISQQLPLIPHKVAPSVQGYPDPTEEQYLRWEGPIFQAMREGKRFDALEIKNSFRSNGRVNGFKFEANLDNAMERIDAEVRKGINVECWGRKVGMSDRESWEFKYQRAGGPPLLEMDGWKKIFPPPLPPKVAMKRPAPKNGTQPQV